MTWTLPPAISSRPPQVLEGAAYRCPVWSLKSHHRVETTYFLGSRLPHPQRKMLVGKATRRARKNGKFSRTSVVSSVSQSDEREGKRRNDEYAMGCISTQPSGTPALSPSLALVLMFSHWWKATETSWKSIDANRLSSGTAGEAHLNHPRYFFNTEYLQLL